jgi:hypothetical protein
MTFGVIAASDNGVVGAAEPELTGGLTKPRPVANMVIVSPAYTGLDVLIFWPVR